MSTQQEFILEALPERRVGKKCGEDASWSPADHVHFIHGAKRWPAGHMLFCGWPLFLCSAPPLLMPTPIDQTEAAADQKLCLKIHTNNDPKFIEGAATEESARETLNT